MGHSTITALSVWLLVSSASRNSRKQDAKECALTTENILNDSSSNRVAINTLTKEPVGGAVGNGVKDDVEEKAGKPSDAFIDWTFTLKSTLKRKLDEGRDLVVMGEEAGDLDTVAAAVLVVMGNEAGDLDTVASSLVMAYMRGGLPILPFPQSELYLRPDIEWLLRDIGIPSENLIYIDNEGVKALLEGEGYKVILTDHNEPMPILEDKVIGIFDHHKDENRCGNCGAADRYIFGDKAFCRSATTLVALVGLKNTEPYACRVPRDPAANCPPGTPPCVKNTQEVQAKLWRDDEDSLCTGTRDLTPAAARLVRGAILQDSHDALDKGKGVVNNQNLDHFAREGLQQFFTHHTQALVKVPDEDDEFVTLFNRKQFQSDEGEALWSNAVPEKLRDLLLMDSKIVKYPKKGKKEKTIAIILASLKVEYAWVAEQSNLKAALDLVLKPPVMGIEITIVQRNIGNSGAEVRIQSSIQSKIYYGDPDLFTPYLASQSDHDKGTPDQKRYRIPDTPAFTSLAFMDTHLEGRPKEVYAEVVKSIYEKNNAD